MEKRSVHKLPQNLDMGQRVWGPCPGCQAGCAGAGIPCRLNRKGTGDLGRILQGWKGSTFTYQVVDVNDNPVQGISSVNEYWVDGTGMLPDQGQWTSGNDLLNGNVLPNGTFLDGVGMSPGPFGYSAGFSATQDFSATVGGTNYVIGTSNSLLVTHGFGGMVVVSRP